MPIDISASLPQEFKDFRGLHAGESIIVCGCGSSLSQIVAPERTITIGVNDVGRLFDPDYLVVLNPSKQFTEGRFSYVAKSRARAIFTQLDLQIEHPRIVRFRLGKRGGTDVSDQETLPYTRNSPYVAIALAMYMGARRIGIIGVDFTDDHFFGPTGRHMLAGELAQIEGEYKRLYESCLRQGTEVFNLSQESRLTVFPKLTQEDFANRSLSRGDLTERRIFFVNYDFLSCGHVFRDGLAHAADALGVTWGAASWDDPELDQKVAAYKPDLLFVVHGRKFSVRWSNRFAEHKSAVWLLDEPYEVDDTSKFSSLFDTVFVNDPSTLHRHQNAHYLPVCYDPDIHTYTPGEVRPYAAGFIGGFSPQREEALARLAKHDLLSYVVGGPWRDQAITQICKSPRIPAEQSARLYRQSRIVVNLFRSKNHYNRDAIPAMSMNPRVYEALGCGALVISEYRSELETVCPEIPTFRNIEELEFQIELHLGNPNLFAQVRRVCIRRLASHTYTQRLAAVISQALQQEKPVIDSSAPVNRVFIETSGIVATQLQLPPDLEPEWEASDNYVQVAPNGEVSLRLQSDASPGCERGMTGRHKHGNIVLEFDVFIEKGAKFIAKIHHEEAHNQQSNSYHLTCRENHGYLARHNRVLSKFTLPVEIWVPITISYSDGILVVRRSGAEIARATDCLLEVGYSFLGVVSGSARLRNIRVTTPLPTGIIRRSPPRKLQTLSPIHGPVVSIVTTVYDRVDCLEQCIQSVQALALHLRHMLSSRFRPSSRNIAPSLAS